MRTLPSYQKPGRRGGNRSRARGVGVTPKFRVRTELDSAAGWLLLLALLVVAPFRGWAIFNWYAQPTNTTVQQFSNATFYAQVTCANGNCTPNTYTWLRNGMVVSSYSTNFPSSSYTITDVSVNNNGDKYAVGVKDASSSSPRYSSTGIVQVVEKPTFTTLPVSATRIVGSSASFIAIADGNPPPTYYWWSNGVTINRQGLSFGSIETNDARIYVVTASNAYGSISSTVSLTVVVVPQLNAPPWLTNAQFQFSPASFPPQTNYLTQSNFLVVISNIQVSTDLTASSWVSLGAATNAVFVDNKATNFSRRFYRAIWP